MRFVGASGESRQERTPLAIFCAIVNTSLALSSLAGFGNAEKKKNPEVMLKPILLSQ
jgi:hypothetical protein